MLLDKNQIYSDKQAITATAVSEEVVDLFNADIGLGNAYGILVLVSETFNNLTSLKIDLQDSDSATGTFANVDTVPASVTVPLAGLTKGDSFWFPLPYNGERYSRFNYTVTGTAPTTGKIFAAVTPSKSQWYKDSQKIGGYSGS